MASWCAQISRAFPLMCLRNSRMDRNCGLGSSAAFSTMAASLIFERSTNLTFPLPRILSRLAFHPRFTPTLLSPPSLTLLSQSLPSRLSSPICHAGHETRYEKRFSTSSHSSHIAGETAKALEAEAKANNDFPDYRYFEETYAVDDRRIILEVLNT